MTVNLGDSKLSKENPLQLTFESDMTGSPKILCPQVIHVALASEVICPGFKSWTRCHTCTGLSGGVYVRRSGRLTRYARERRLSVAGIM